MDVLAYIFGLSGLAVALMAYMRIDKLEKKLKSLGVIEGDFSSGQELP